MKRAVYEKALKKTNELLRLLGANEIDRFPPGEPMVGESCPVARAFVAQLGGSCAVNVDNTDIDAPAVALDIVTPPEIAAFVKSFDDEAVRLISDCEFACPECGHRGDEDDFYAESADEVDPWDLVKDKPKKKPRKKVVKKTKKEGRVAQLAERPVSKTGG